MLVIVKSRDGYIGVHYYILFAVWLLKIFCNKFYFENFSLNHNIKKRNRNSAFNKVGIERMHINIREALYDKPQN